MSNVYTGNEVLNKILIDDGLGNNFMAVKGSISIGGSRVKVQQSQDLSVGQFDYTTAIPSDFMLRGFTVHSDAELMEDVNIWLKEVDDNYTTLVYYNSFIDEDGNGSSNMSFFSDSDLIIPASLNSQVRITISNNNLTGNVYVSLFLEVL